MVSSKALSGTLILQRKVEMVLQKGAPVVYHYHAKANSSAENPSPESHPGLNCTRMDAIWKKFIFKMKYRFKINITQEWLKLRSIQ
jgi:hypothetical protein